MRRIVAALAVTGLLALAPAGAAGAGTAEHRASRIDMIRIAGFTFYPNDPRVSAGQVVSVKNYDWGFFMEPHTLTAIDGSFNTGLITADVETFVAPTTPGRYQFKCLIHPNMRGLLMVRP